MAASKYPLQHLPCLNRLKQLNKFGLCCSHSANLYSVFHFHCPRAGLLIFLFVFISFLSVYPFITAIWLSLTMNEEKKKTNYHLWCQRLSMGDRNCCKEEASFPEVCPFLHCLRLTACCRGHFAQSSSAPITGTHPKIFQRSQTEGAQI